VLPAAAAHCYATGMKTFLLLLLGILAASGCRSTPPAGGERPVSSLEDTAALQPTQPAPEFEDGGKLDSDRPADPSAPLQPFPGVTVLVEEEEVWLQAWVCLEAGWLEQIACAPGTREHESLVVPRAQPGQIHAALLMAGFEPGRPGSWTAGSAGYSFVPPRGSKLEVLARYATQTGQTIEEPIRNWIRDHGRRQDFPSEPWVFGGSLIEPNPEWMEPGEHYVADLTGSIIGLVTFGDEVIGFSRVFADQASVQPPEWEVDRQRIPPVGTEVTLILRRWQGVPAVEGTSVP